MPEAAGSGTLCPGLPRVSHCEETGGPEGSEAVQSGSPEEPEPEMGAEAYEGADPELGPQMNPEPEPEAETEPEMEPEPEPNPEPEYDPEPEPDVEAEDESEGVKLTKPGARLVGGCGPGGRGQAPHD